MELSELKDTLGNIGAIDRNDSASDGLLALDVDRLIEDPICTNSVVVDLLHLLPRNVRPEAVLSLSDDALFGFALATAAWARFYYADPVGKRTTDGNASLELNHGFAIPKGRKVVVVASKADDAAQLASLVDLARACDAEVIGVMALQSSLSEKAIANVPVYALLQG